MGRDSHVERSTKLISMVLGASLVFITGIFIFRTLATTWQTLPAELSHLGWVVVVSASLLFAAYLYCRALSWHFLMVSLRQPLRHGASLPTWFYGEATRYIPGFIWSFANRTYLAGRHGAAKSVTLISLGMEAAMMVAATAAVSLPILFFHNQYAIWLALCGVGLAVLVGIGYTLSKHRHHPLLAWFAEIPGGWWRTSSFVLALLTQFLAWIAFGAASYVIMATYGHGNLFYFVAIAVFAWLAGYLSLVTPMGLGVRESVFIILASAVLGVGPAAIVAILSRFILTVVEVVNVGLWAVATRLRKSRWDFVVLGAGIASYIAVFSVLSIRKHMAFATGYDLSNMDQTIWNTLHGHLFELMNGTVLSSRFTVHADIVLAFLAPLYAVWDNVRSLLILQSVAIGVGAIPLYLLARRVLHHKVWALLIIVVYFANPGMQWANLYDFHAVTLAIPLFLTALYLATIKRWRWYFATVLLLLCVREEVGFIVGLMGLGIAIGYREIRIGITTLVVGFLWSLLMFTVVVPHFSPNGESWAMAWYERTNTPGILSVLPLPRDMEDRLLTGVVPRTYYPLLLKAFAYAPLLGLPWLLVASPEMVINVLSKHAQMQSIMFHYDSTIVPWMNVATVFGLSYVLLFLLAVPYVRRYASFLVTIALLGIVGVALLEDYRYGPLPVSPHCFCVVYQPTAEDMAFDRELAKIPPSASVTASPEIRPHITHRLLAYTIPDMSQSADYVALIDQNRNVYDYSPKGYELTLITQLSHNPAYELVSHVGHFYLYRKR